MLLTHAGKGEVKVLVSARTGITEKVGGDCDITEVLVVAEL